MSEIPVKKAKKEKPEKPILQQQVSVSQEGDLVVIKIPKRLLAKQLFSF